MDTSSTKRRFIDLFAGCGGLSLGLEYAGFEPFAFTEISEEAAKTYLKNRPHLPGLENRHFLDTWELVKNGDKDRQNLDRDVFPEDEEFDLVVGGPPCQGFSRLGLRRNKNHKHDRLKNPGNFLYVAMADVIKLAQPKIFLFENVQGLLNARWEKGKGKPGEIFEEVLKTFSRINLKGSRSKWPGYVMRYRLVKAHEYGVPQNRPRLLLVGIRRDIAEKLNLATDKSESNSHRPLKKRLAGEEGDGFHPDPTNDFPTPEEAIGDLIDDEYDAKRTFCRAGAGPQVLVTPSYTHRAEKKFQKKMRRLPREIAALVAELELRGWNGKKRGQLFNHIYSNHTEATVDRFKVIQNHGRAKGTKVENKKFSQRALQETWPNSIPNITVTSMPDDYVHYAQPRSLTVREWARLQTFPDWYEFFGKRTTGGTRRAGRPNDGDFSRDVPRYTQIGNAVPPFLAAAIGKHFNQLLDLAEGSS